MKETKSIVHGVEVDYSRDSLFDTLGLERLRDSYMMESENSPQERFAYVSSSFASNPAHAQRLYDYASKHWLSYSTPILAYGRNKRGLAISCFLSYLHDSSAGLVDTLSEVNWLSMMGGGVGVHVGIRAVDDKSVGIMPHMKTYDASSLAYKQGRTRRGSYAMYLDISHPDIIEFLEMRKPTGDQNTRCLNLHNAVNISDEFMQHIEKAMADPSYDDSWDLIDPASKEVRETVSAKALWQKLLILRMETGEPYLNFIDTINRALPDYQKKLGLSVKGSNLCNEIHLVTDKERTAVCCLSSANAEYFDEWRDHPLFLHDVAEMLDNVLQKFIDDAPDVITRAKYSAMRERSIGIGVLGFHSYLQRHMIPFESAMATGANIRIFKHMRTQLDAANSKLGAERGSNLDYLEVYGPDAPPRRFTHLMAVAPNASSSIIMGNCSPSIEPFKANVYRQDTLSGAYTNRNKYLDVIIKKECESNPKLDYTDVWRDILANEGSVQHLKWMSTDTKDVFKTALEIDQLWIIDHAAKRQDYIDQGQSINIFFTPDTNVKYLHAVHFAAWKKGLKGLYYCRSEKLGKASKLSTKVQREKIEDMDIRDMLGEGCIACE